jgi:hypothetical protein
MEPDYAAFWPAFRATTAWAGMMAMARFQPHVELRVLRLRVEMLEAIVGGANPVDIQEAIWRLMEFVGSQTDPQQVGELVDTHGLLAVYSLRPP